MSIDSRRSFTGQSFINRSRYKSTIDSPSTLKFNLNLYNKLVNKRKSIKNFFSKDSMIFDKNIYKINQNITYSTALENK